MKIIDPSILNHGDALIFSRKGVFDTIIRIKTWSPATHVEIYIGNGKTVAARNGIGCAVYPVDLNGLYCVLRPKLKSFDLVKAMAAFSANEDGRPYGWLALFSFCLLDLHDKGRFCSELATIFWRDGGFDAFNRWIKAEIVAPGDLLYIHHSVVERIWSRD